MRLILVTGIIFIWATGWSQQYIDSNDPREIKSLLSRENDLNGFGGADIRVTDLKGERAMVIGGYGGVLVNRAFMLGIAGYGIATNPEFEGTLPDGLLPDTTMNGVSRKLTINGGYAGIMLGGILFTRELVHVTIPVIVAAGEIQVSDEDFFQNSTDTDYTIESATFFVGEPGVQLEFNMTSTFRIAVGASYRFVHGLELDNITDNDMTNWTGTISFRFGRY